MSPLSPSPIAPATRSVVASKSGFGMVAMTPDQRPENTNRLLAAFVPPAS
jgi:hypothetical protein